jgi:hypothetical protein
MPMLLAHKKPPVRVAKFFKLIMPKTTNTEAYFKSIKSDVVNRQIIYRLYDSNEMSLFYKKANLNVYRKAEKALNNLKLDILKSNILKRNLSYAYANEDHEFNVYFADEFLIIVYSENVWNSELCCTWNVIIYDTINNTWSRYDSNFYNGGIYGFYYLKKCRSVVLPIGRPIFSYPTDKPILSDEPFYSSHDTRRGFNLQLLHIIYLTELTDDGRYPLYAVNIESEVDKYIRAQSNDMCLRASDMIIDYSIDENNGIVYMVFKIKCYLDNGYKINVTVLEYDMCKAFNRDLKIFGIKASAPIISGISGKEKMLLYLSDRKRKDRQIPKYLPMHMSIEFYDFMSNKLFHADMIFSSHLRLLVKDKYFNRVDGTLYKIESLKVAAQVPLQEDIITMRSGRNGRLLAVLLMNDLSVVKEDYTM